MTIQNLYATQTPSVGATDVFETSPVTVGTKFYVTVDGASCIGGRFFGPSTIGVSTFELRLFEQLTADSGSATGTLRANKTFPSITDEVWNPLLFDAAFPLIKNKIYCIAAASSQGRYTALLNGFQSAGISNAGIFGPQTNTNPVGSGNVYNGVFGPGLVNFPNQTFNGHAYLVDPTIEFADPTFDPKRASAFLVFL